MRVVSVNFTRSDQSFWLVDISLSTPIEQFFNFERKKRFKTTIYQADGESDERGRRAERERDGCGREQKEKKEERARLMPKAISKVIKTTSEKSGLKKNAFESLVLKLGNFIFGKKQETK